MRIMRHIFFILFAVVFLLTSCKTMHKLGTVDTFYAVDSKNGNEDETINQIIAPYKMQLDEEMSEIIGYNLKEIIKAKPESKLGNFVADAIHQMAEKILGSSIDFTIQNYGGIRIPSVQSGDITVGKIFELMPFENRISIMELDSSAVSWLVAHMAADGGWPVSKELRYQILYGQPKRIRVNGEKVRGDRKYIVALPDYVANGGDRVDFLGTYPRNDLAILVRDALIEYIRDLSTNDKPVDVKIDGRVVILNE